MQKIWRQLARAATILTTGLFCLALTSGAARADSLSDWTTYNEDGTTRYVEETTVGGRTAIHIFDEASGMVGITRSFPAKTGIWGVSFDVYVAGHAAASGQTWDPWLRNFFTSGEMDWAGGSKTNVVNESYLMRGTAKGKGNNGSNVSIQLRTVAESTTEIAVLSPYFQVGAWHNIKYVLDIPNQTYDVYLDDTLVSDNYAFYAPFVAGSYTSVDHFSIGSGGSYFADFAISNFEFFVPGQVPAEATPSATIDNSTTDMTVTGSGLTLAGTVTDTDSGQTLTVKATIDEVTKTMTVATPANAQAWVLSWDKRDLRPGTYSDVVVSVTDGEASASATYTGTITVPAATAGSALSAIAFGEYATFAGQTWQKARYYTSTSVTSGTYDELANLAYQNGENGYFVMNYDTNLLSKFDTTYNACTSSDSGYSNLAAANTMPKTLTNFYTNTLTDTDGIKEKILTTNWVTVIEENCIGSASCKFGQPAKVSGDGCGTNDARSGNTYYTDKLGLISFLEYQYNPKIFLNEGPFVKCYFLRTPTGESVSANVMMMGNCGALYAWASTNMGLRPTVRLNNKEVEVASGSGTSADPYVLQRVASDLTMTLTNSDVDVILNEDESVTFAGTVTDTEASKSVTVSATIGGVTKTTPAIATPFTDRAWSLTWSYSELRSGAYTDMVFTASDGTRSQKVVYEASLVVKPIPPATRQKYSFNYDWYFAKGVGYNNAGSDLASTPVTVIPTSEDPTSTSYVLDTRWQHVSLPHTYNDTDTFNNFTEAGMNGERSMYSGTAWYVKKFNVPEAYNGKKVYLTFEAARQAAKVWLNGTQLTGNYENGFIPFGYDLTPYLVSGQNVLAVQVNNSFPYYIGGGTSGAAVPWHDSHWHPNFGGLYRNSYLYVVDELHFTLPVYSFLETQGTYVYTNNESATRATFNVAAEIENNKATAQTFYWRATVYDAERRAVLTLTSTAKTLAAGAKEVFDLSGVLNNPKRWSDDYPYLYTVETELYQMDGATETILDSDRIPFGVRTFRMTNDAGFYINENYTELNGWGQKSTNEWAGLGAAYPDWMQDLVIKMMKEANGNYLRWGHVAGGATQVDAADRYGIMVTQPGVDSEGNYEGTYTASTRKLRAEAFRDMLIYFRNHPSIIMWEVGNSASSMTTSMANSELTAIAGLDRTNLGTTSTLAEVMYTLANSWDYGNRGTIGNAGAYASTVSQSNRLLAVRQGTDTNMVNFVDVGETTEGKTGMNSSTFGNKPAVEGEYNRLEIRRSIWDTQTANMSGFYNTTSSGNDADGYSYKYMTNEMFATAEVKKKAAIFTKTAYVGGANWIFSDSTSHGRVNSETSRVSGEVDATMLPKEAYYASQVINANKPGIHIIGHWNYPASTTKTIYVVARDVETVKLYVNDHAYDLSSHTGYLWQFNNVVYDQGTIRAEGLDAANNVVVRDSITTHGAPDHLKMTKITGPGGWRADGSDIMLVDVEVVDADGNRCLTYNGTLPASAMDKTYFTIDDPEKAMTWRGGYNSGIEYSTNNEYLYIEAGITRVALRATFVNETVTLGAFTESGLTTEASLSATPRTIVNTNGVSELNINPIYDLSNLTDPGYGNGNYLGQTTDPNQSTNNDSILVHEFAYIGANNNGIGIASPLAVGKKMYADSSETFTKIPYKYLNAEYLLLSDADRSVISADWVNFVAKRDIDVYLLRDPSVDNPSFIESSFSLVPDEHIIGGNGVVYDIYKRTVTKGTGLFIGGNAVNDTGLNGHNHIIMVKETAKVADQVFFDEDFSDFDRASIVNGWNAVISSGHIVEATTSADNTNNPALHFEETDTNMSFVEKSFSPQTSPFYLKFRAWVSNRQINNWLRIWLSNDKIVTASNQAHVAVETYFMHQTATNTYYNLSARLPNSTGVNPLGGRQMSFNSWHTYVYYVDPITHTFQVTIDGIETPVQNFVVNENSLNNVVIGSSGSSTTDYYVDDVEIVPIPDSVITNVQMDGTAVSGFADEVKEYYFEDLTASSSLTFEPTLYYESSTLVYSASESAQVLTVTDVLGQEWVYKFTAMSEDPLLADWILHNANNSTLWIRSDVLNDEPVIHLYDHVYTAGDAAATYMEREFPAQTSGKFKISYAAYVHSASDNQSLRFVLLNGTQVAANYVNKTNWGVETYLYEGANADDGTSANQVAWRAYTGYDSNTGVAIKETVPTSAMQATNVWNYYEMMVDMDNKTYSLAVGTTANNLTTVYEDVPFVTYTGTPVTSLDHIEIGTPRAATAEFYVKDYSFELIYESPLKNLAVVGDGHLVAEASDGAELVDTYRPEISNYDYYSEDGLTALTEINVTPDVRSYRSHIIDRNLIRQEATVTAINNDGEIYTYVITFRDLSQRIISKEKLQELIERVEALTATDYTDDTWNDVLVALAAARVVVADNAAEQIDITRAYYELLNKWGDLLLAVPVPVNSSYVGDFVYASENVSAGVELKQVLGNGAQVYSDEEVVFHSVPKKYMNAEYLLLQNMHTTRRGGIYFTTRRETDVLVFKDRRAGALTAHGFVDTGDIVTSEEGVVYKVYKKTVPKQARVSLNLDNVIGNYLTYKNAIIAFKDSANVTNNEFFYVNVDRYESSPSAFQNDWGLLCSTGNSALTGTLPQKNSVGFGSAQCVTSDPVELADDQGGYKAIHLQSSSVNLTPSTYSTQELYRQIAKVYDHEMDWSYQAFIDSSSSYDNDYLRTWLVNDGISSAWRTTDTEAGDKSALVSESYLHNQSNSYGVVWSNRSGARQTTVAPITKGQWSSVVRYRVKPATQKYDVYYNDVLKSSAPVFRSSTNLPYFDYFMFATRRTGKSNFWLKNIKVTPVEKALVTGLAVNAGGAHEATVPTYSSVTKDYLMSATDLTNKAVIGETVATGYAVNNTVSAEKTTVAITNGTETLNHDVYYEITSDRHDLTACLEEAMDLTASKYTVDSWAVLLEASSAAAAVLRDSETAVATVVTTTTQMCDAVDNLVGINEHYYFYQNNVYYGKTLEASPAANVHITSQSSVTLEASMNESMPDFPYAGEATTRELRMNDVLPAGTRLTLADDSGTVPVYYYYQVTTADSQANKKVFLLTDFKKMGTTDQYYVNQNYYQAASEILRENLKFVVDFEHSTVKPTDGSHSGSLKTTYAGEEIPMEDWVYYTYDRLGTPNFSVSLDAQSYTPEATVTATVQTNFVLARDDEGHEVIDTTRFGKKVGVEVRLYQNNAMIDFPPETVMQVGNYHCYPKGGVCRLLLNEISDSLNEEVKITWGDFNLLSGGNYELQFALFRSFDGANLGNVVDHAQIDYEVSAPPPVSFGISVPGGQANVWVKGETKDLTYNFATRNSVAGTVVVSLEKKQDDNSYSTVTLANYVENDLTGYTTNTYDLGDVNIWTANFNTHLAKGTYRLKFQLYNAGTLKSTVVKNLVVKPH